MVCGEFYFSDHAIRRARQRMGLRGPHPKVLRRLIDLSVRARLVGACGIAQVWRVRHKNRQWHFIVLASTKEPYQGQLVVATIYGEDTLATNYPNIETRTNP